MESVLKKGRKICTTVDTRDLKFFDKNGKEITFKIRPIEPKILPLVKALNDTGLVKTFSSCQGHYKGTDQLQFQDRNFADVRFHLLPGVEEDDVEPPLGDITHKFWDMNLPVHMIFYKLIISKTEGLYVMTLTPKDRYDHPSKKRKDTDAAIKIVTGLVRESGLIK